MKAAGLARQCLEILCGQNGVHGKFPADEAMAEYMTLAESTNKGSSDQRKTIL